MSEVSRRCSRDLLHAGARIVARQLVEADLERDVSAVDAVDLYAGPLGPALFWAAMAKVLPQEAEDHRRRSLLGLRPAREHLARWLDDPGSMADSGVGLGGISGLGGAIYALACAGLLLGRSELLREARDAAALFTPCRIWSDRRLDFVDGTAGALLSLLSLERALQTLPADQRGPGDLALTASICAEHLLAQRVAVAGRLRAWVPAGHRAFCGFAHGASGIAHALLSASRWLREPAWREAAIEAFLYEHRVYRPEIRNWPPFPDFPRDQVPMVAWCWGAPGISLARAAALPDIDEPAISVDLRKGLQTTMESRATLEDHLCCGNLGRALVLTGCARRLAGVDVGLDAGALIHAADRLVYDVLRRVRGRGGFRLSKKVEPGSPQVGFFKGIAGIGYALLDLAEPDLLPRPLLLEAPGWTLVESA